MSDATKPRRRITLRRGLVAVPTFTPAKEDHYTMRPSILALDLEGTLISNAVSQIPRPGLYEFLESAKSLFEGLVIFTTVPESTLR